MLYEGLKDLSMGSKLQNPNFHIDISIEGVMLRGVAGGFSDFNLMFVMNFRYNEWLNAISCVWMAEDAQGMFRGSSPASDPTFMVVEFV
ncbi:unnamed protein product [Prunus brigantina]